MVDKRSTPYTFELLNSIIQESGAQLCGQYEKFNQRMRIEFICRCGAKGSKRFEMLKLYRMPYCYDCSLEENLKRAIKSSIEKYNVENVMHLDPCSF
jgi:tRNA(Ile)-lysidine synthase TilS/MesJ